MSATIIGDPPAPPSDQPDPQEVAALLNGLRRTQRPPEPSDLDIAVAGGLSVVAYPAVIYLKNRKVPFIVDDFRHWGWTPFGVYAEGHWDDDETERHLLFNGDDIETVELQYEAYDAALKAQIEAEEAALEAEAEDVEAEVVEDDEATSD